MNLLAQWNQAAGLAQWCNLQLFLAFSQQHSQVILQCHRPYAKMADILINSFVCIQISLTSLVQGKIFF